VVPIRYHNRNHTKEDITIAFEFEEIKKLMVLKVAAKKKMKEL
jgi:hypothetical protein